MILWLWKRGEEMLEEAEVAVGEKEVFKTTTCMGLKRQLLSYRDVCWNFNGG